MLKYRLKRISKKKLIVWSTMIMLFVISLGSIVSFYAANNAYSDAGSSAVSGTTVTVNDLTSDWDYYMGLNYTEVTQTNVLPGMNSLGTAAQSSEKYNLSSLVAVQINYSGVDVNNANLVGTVSDSENQNKFIYYEYHPLVDSSGNVVEDGNSGNLVIELIDNPWTSRPEANGVTYGFNGWVCEDSNEPYAVSCSDVTFSYDYNYYVRYVTIPLSAISTVNGEKMVSISLKTSWTPAVTITSSNNEGNFKDNIMELIGTSTTNNVTSYYFSEGQSTEGYYYKMNASSMTSDKSLYYDSDGQACDVGGSCNSTVYKLIQPTDSFATYTYDRDSNGDGVNDYSSIAGNYYYLPTRDTNLYLTTYASNLSITEFETECPFTITGNGTVTGSLSMSSFTLSNDFGIDNVTLNGPTYYNTAGYNNYNKYPQEGTRSSGSYFNSSSYNLKIGRNVKPRANSGTTSYFTAYAVYGGTNNKVIVESGVYQWMRALPTSNTNGNHTIIVYGSDYDRVTNNNSNLKVAYQAVSSSSANHNSGTVTPASEVIVKSGTFGSALIDMDHQTDNYYTYGIYAGGISGGSSTAFRTLKIEGGRVFSINGGPCIAEGAVKKNVIGIYITDGEVDNVVGGAGTSTTYGNRIVSVTGGQVNNAVAGGSNSYTYSGNTSSGPMTGNTLVYVGGDAKLGDTLGYNYNDDSSTVLYGIQERGSVFGAGLGRSGNNYTDLGRVSNSHVIINGGTINGSVYGGGNYGSVGTSSSMGATSAVVDVLSGTISGSVFGAANQNGAGYNGSSSSSGGTKGGLLAKDYYVRIVYGNNEMMPKDSYLDKRGSGITPLTADTRCDSNNYTSSEGGRNNRQYSCTTYSLVTKDTPYDSSLRYYTKTDYYGYIYFSSVDPETYTPDTSEDEEEDDSEEIIENNYPHTIYMNLNGGTIKQSMYGGSNQSGQVYANVNINLYNGSVVNTNYGVYGGGKGSSTTLYGNTIVKTNTTNDSSLNINEIYGGSELGTVNENGGSYVTINGGTINTVYGGGKGGTDTNGNALSPTTKGPISVSMKDGTVSTIFGGNNIYGTITTKMKVSMSGGIVDTVFGGSNGGDAGATNTNVDISGGRINFAVYGGGKLATTTNNTHVTITGGTYTELDSLGNALYGDTTAEVGAEIYGGGEQAAVDGTATVDINDGTVYKVFGGSNQSGNVKTTIVNNTGGKVLCNTYGGGNMASVGTSNNNLNGTEYVYTMPDNVNTYTTKCGNAFAGGASADVTTANITLNGSSLINVYGGSDQKKQVTTSYVKIFAGNTINVFGGNNAGGTTVNANVTIDETDYYDNGTKILGKNLTVTNVFGGSNGAEASINNGTKVDIIDGIISGNVYGGGNKAPVIVSTNVNVYDGVINSVFGGGNEAHIGSATVTSEGNYITGNLQGETTVNVIGGTINKNVYGSGNSSFVDGSTEVNIGNDAISKLNISDTSSLNLNLKITGSVFGGSETNTDGETVFDNSFVGVYDSATINVDGKSYIKDNVSNLVILGSFNGGGNNSMVKGISTIYIDNFGAKIKPNSSTSIQRASNVYVTDSYFQLSGTRNRATTDSYKYSIISVGSLYLLGSGSEYGSHLYLVTGATYFGNLYSGSFASGSFKEQTVVDNNGTLVRDVSDNRLYMADKNVLAVTGYSNAFASYDFDTATPGEVHGMTFLGLYERSTMNKGVYDYTYTNGSEYDSSVSGTISNRAYTYVYGINYTSQTEEEQIKTNGFYTNVLEEDGVTVNYQYVGVTPKDAPYYKWVIGEEPIVIKVDLTADKYSESGTVNANIPIADLLASLGAENPTEWSDASLQITGVNASSFVSDAVGGSYNGYLIDKSEIPTVNTNDVNGDGVIDANNYFALSMGTTTSGWLDNYKTNFYSDKNSAVSNFCTTDAGNGGCTNDEIYLYDSTNKQRSLSFWLYHSKNLDFSYIDKSEDAENMTLSMGQIDIYAVLTNPHGDPNNALENNLEVTIEVYVYLSDGELDKYGAIIAPGKQYEVFQGKPTTITSDGAFSIYQSLSLDLNGVKAGSACKESWSVEKLYNTAGYANVLDKDCNENTVYWSEAYRYLASSYLLPEGTIITMLDLKNNRQYYYEVTAENYAIKQSEFASKNLVKYYLEDFIRMGSTTTTNLFDDDMNGANSKNYYYQDPVTNSKLAVEEFIFTVDFAKADTSDITSSVQHSFYLQLERYKSSDANNIDTYGVAENILSTDIDKMVYTIVPEVESVIETTGGYVQSDGSITEDTVIYVGDTAELLLNTNLIHLNSDSDELTSVSDTKFEEYKLGAKLSIIRPKLDSNGNVIEGEFEQLSTDLFGTVVTINGKSYYPQTDGSIRIELAGRITDVASSIEIDFENSSLTYGDDYILVVETFVSYDGLYYGDFEPTYNEFPFVLLNNQYGMEVKTETSAQVTHDVNTGEDVNGDREIHYNLDVINGLADPKLKISLERRIYENAYDTQYESVDLANLVEELRFGDSTTNILADSNYCYLADGTKCLYYNLSDITNNSVLNTYDIYMKLKNGPVDTDLGTNKPIAKWKSGTYRVIFTLYDGDVAVGSVYEYLIIRSLGIDEIVIEGSGN